MDGIEKKEKLIILTGPTAVGKTAASIELAKRLDGEIISADSMQVYRGMDIGTAKITREEMQGVPHHLIDIIEPDEEFNVIIFKELAKKAVEDIHSRGKVPIVVGGTGFYIQALCYDVDFASYDEAEQERVRQTLNDELERCGSLYMHKKLEELDPASAAAIHMNNTKRMLNAIEFFMLTGKKISEHNEEQHSRSSPYDLYYFVLNDARESIYQRIDQRVDQMMDMGLLDEVRELMNKGYDLSDQSMLGLGYKEIFDHLSGLTTLDEAIRLIKRDTRHFAKKQLTWFKRERDVVFIDKRDYTTADAVCNYIINKVFEK